MKKIQVLERADFAEQVGVNSDAVIDITNYYESVGMRVDSFMVVRNSKVACECHWSPNDANVPHDMFSLSKSITGIAVGLAVDEGIISLDTKIYETYFPEKLAKLEGEERERAEKITIYHVISMRMGKVTSVFDNKSNTDWIDGILDKPCQFVPGEGWKYISENAFLLSWILQKETGMTMVDYLTPRVFEPLGIKKPHWEMNQDGVDAGGWGLKLTAEDVAKIAILYLNKGVYNGKRIFSEKWYDDSVYPHTLADEVYPIFTEKSDYGYQVWIDHENNDTTYRMTGLYGQHVFLFPEYDAAVIMTASDNRDEELIHSVYDRFPKGFIEPQKKADEEKVAKFKAIMNSKAIDPKFKNPSGKRRPIIEKKISGRIINLPPAVNLSTQGSSTYFMWRKKIGYLNDIKFEFNKDGFDFSFKEQNSDRAVIKVGMNGEFVRNIVVLGENELTIDAQAVWNKNGTLEMFLHNTGRPQTRRFTFTFLDKIVKVATSTDPGYGDVLKFNIEFNMGMRVGPKLEKVIGLCYPVFKGVYSDPSLFGVVSDKI